MSFKFQNRIFQPLKLLFGVESPNAIDTLSDELLPVWNAVNDVQDVILMTDLGKPASFGQLGVMHWIHDNPLGNPPAFGTDRIKQIFIQDYIVDIVNSSAVDAADVRLRLNEIFDDDTGINNTTLENDLVNVPANSTVTFIKEVDKFFSSKIRFSKIFTGIDRYRRLVLTAENNGPAVNADITYSVKTHVKVDFSFDTDLKLTVNTGET